MSDGSSDSPREPAAFGTSGSPRPRGPSDPEVVSRVLEGHRDDYRVLIQRYQERFHRFAFGMVDDPDAATDLIQDSFVKAYTNLDACKNPARFESWAYQILRNRCRDYLKNIRRTHEPLDESPTLVAARGMPEKDLERAELRRDLREALATLPGAHREAFLLKHLDGYTYQEISEELGASLSAVKMRVHRSREMLQEYFESRPENPGSTPGTGPKKEEAGGEGDDDVTIRDPRSSSEMKTEVNSETRSS